MGWIFGYELKADTCGDLSHISPHPDAQFIFADRVIAFDHHLKCIYLVTVDDGRHEKSQAEWRDATARKLQDLEVPPAPSTHGIEFSLSRTDTHYRQDIAACLEGLQLQIPTRCV